MLKEGDIIKHNGLSLLSRVQGPDPEDTRKYIVKPLGSNNIMSVWERNVERLK